MRKKDVHKNTVKNKDYYRLYDMKRNLVNKERRAAKLKYSKTKKGKELQNIRMSKWSKLNRHKKNAHQKVKRAIASGLLIKELCEQCGKPAQAHHDDYSKPLSVRWLCIFHHRKHHKEERLKEFPIKNSGKAAVLLDLLKGRV